MKHLQETIRNKISEIAHALEKQQQCYSDFSVSYGELGYSLFLLFQYRLTGDWSYFHRCQASIESVFIELTSGKFNTESMPDLVELGIFIEFLYEVIGQENDNEFMTDLDEIIGHFMETQIKHANFTPSTGATLAGRYFLIRKNKSELAATNLEKCIQAVRQAAIPEPRGGISWTNNFRGEACKELGITHGQAGITLFLLKVLEQDPQHTVCASLIKKSIKFILDAAYSGGNQSLFYPITVNKERNSDALTISYGDLGIAYLFYRAGGVLKNDDLKKESERIFLYYSQNKRKLRKCVYDGNLVYGAAGLYALYYKLYQETAVLSYMNAADFWLRQTINYGIHQNEFAGYEFRLNAIRPYTNVSFCEGIAGIGIALMTALKTDLIDFLNFLNYD